jgi:hypothetical protein
LCAKLDPPVRITPFQISSSPIVGLTTASRFASAVNLILLCGILTAGLARESAAQDARFIGTWVTERDNTLSVTTMAADGTFRSEQFLGLKPVGLVEGTWTQRNNSLAWTYLNPKIDQEDVNPILSSSANEFILRETDGSQTTFQRKGVVDPRSPDILPVAIGTGWVLDDKDGELGIRISIRQTFAGQECYRVDWMVDFLVFQSEYWSVREDGIWVVGRRDREGVKSFDAPFQLLKRQSAPGDKWAATVKLGPLSENYTVVVGAEEDVTTPAGTFRATLVIVTRDVNSHARWFARGVGLVREDPGFKSGAANSSSTNMLLKRRIQ